MRFDAPEILDRWFGMTCYVTDGDGVRGALKEREEDWIVEEILPDGAVLELERPVLRPSGYEGLWTHFVLIKRGLGSYDAIYLLARELGVPISHFSWAGNKDKIGITVQRVSVWGVPPERLLAVRVPGITIASPIRELRRVHIGELAGNRFTIRIRNTEPERVRELIEEFNETGWTVNYFGYQRFGVTRPLTHIVGKLLVMKRYEDALVLYICSPSPVETPVTLEAKRAILEGDIKRGARMLPEKTFMFEREMLREYARTGDAMRAWKVLPAWLLNIVAESYQSYLWNRTVSRLAERGYDLLAREGRGLKVPLVGHNTELGDDDVSRVVKEILEEEEITIPMFKNRRFPPLTIRGTQRVAILRTQISVLSSGDDWVTIRFTLKPGAFATTVLREIFKHRMLEAMMSRVARERGLDTIIRRFHVCIEVARRALDGDVRSAVEWGLSEISRYIT